MSTIIDIFCHIFPERYFQEMTRAAPNLENMGKRLKQVTKLFDLDARFREDAGNRAAADVDLEAAKCFGMVARLVATARRIGCRPDGHIPILVYEPYLTRLMSVVNSVFIALLVRLTGHSGLLWRLT